MSNFSEIIVFSLQEVNKMITNDKQQTQIQLLRGLAIIAVVLIHNTPIGLTQVFIRPFLNFSVGLFLFLSGLLSNACNWKPLKRIKKVIIPYIISTFIYCFLQSYNNLSIMPVSFLKNLITGKSEAMMYYIFVYCQFTLLIPLIDKLAKSRLKYLGFIIAPFEIIFMRTIPLMTNWYDINSYVEIIKSVSCLGWFTYFYLGYLLGNNYVSIKNPTKIWGRLLAASVLLQVAEGYWQYSKGIVNCGTQLKISSIFTGVCFVILAYQFINSKKEYNNKIMMSLGNNSFGIYFSHIAVMAVLSIIPFYDNVVYPLNAVIVIVVNMAFIYIGKKVLGKYSKYLAL